MANTEMTLIEHLDELRKRLIYSFLTIASLAVVAYIFRNEIMSVLTRPLGLGPLLSPTDMADLMDKLRLYLTSAVCNGQPCFTSPEVDALAAAARRAINTNTGLIFLTPTEAFFGYIKLSLYTGLLVGAPFWLYHLWKFVAPALYAHERRFVLQGIFFGSLLFYAGAAFCYFVVLPVALHFLMTVGQPYLTPTFTLNNYVSFIMLFMLIFGLSFELPMAMFILVKVGLVKRQTFISKWRYAVAGAFIAATLLPSPDIFSQVAMGSALTVLYGLGLLVTRFARRPEVEPTGEGLSTSAAGDPDGH